MGTQDSISQKEIPAALPGLSLKFDVIEDQDETGQLLTLIDSVFGVSLIESKDNIMIIDDAVRQKQVSYYSNPYEQFCKENFSFLSKYLR